MYIQDSDTHGLHQQHTHAHAYRRTDESHGSKRKQGVNAPSQIRYVSYIERILKDNVDHVSSKPVILNKVCFWLLAHLAG